MNRILFYLFTAVTYILPATTTAQYENVWAFGRQKGLDFNSGSPVLITAAIDQTEGCASVCDAQGKLLFYSEGNKVWDRQHNLMPNGFGIVAANERVETSAQAALIVPVPGSADQYYLFSVGVVNMTFGPATLYYSVIDMTLNNGMGNIVPGRKGIVIDSSKMLTERLTAIPGSNCNIWVITCRDTTNTYLAYEVSAAGINTTPVVSNSGGVLAHIGALCGSPDHRKLVATNFGTHPLGLIVSDFDPATGIVSNSVQLDISGEYYSACFSPDNSKLYVSESDLPIHSSRLWQFDLSAPNPAAAKTLLHTIGPYPGGSSAISGIKLAPDQKVYVIQNDGFMGRVDQPNDAGTACNYVPQGVQVTNPTALPYYGIPNVVPILSGDTMFRVMTDTICDATPLTATDTTGRDYIWNNGSTGKQLTITSSGAYWVAYHTSCRYNVDTFYVSVRLPDTTAAVTDTTVCFVPSVQLMSSEATGSCIWNNGDTGCVRQVTMPDTLWVYSRESCRVTIDTFKVRFIRFDADLGNDTTICDGDSILLDASIPRSGAGYTWQDATTGPVYVVRAPGLYTVMVQVDHCITTDSLMVRPGDTLIRVRDTVVCFAPSVTLTAAPGYEHYLWHQGDTTPFLEVRESQTVWVYATCNCSMVLDSFIVDFIRFAADIGNDTVLCTGSLVLNAAPAGAQYRWHNGVTDPQLMVSAPGVYSVSVSIGPCTDHDTVRIRYEPVLSPVLGDRHICYGRPAILDASTPGATAYLWDDHSTESVRVVREAGTYYVQISNAYCAGADTVEVTLEYCECPVFIPDAFTPNGDGKNDLFGPVVGCPPSGYRLMIYNRYGERVFVSNNVSIKWDGYYKGMLQGPGTFYYHLQFTGKDGEYSYKGDVTLVR